MFQFSIKPQILGFDTVGQLFDHLALTSEDVLITSGYLYEPFIAPHKPACQIVLRDKYGKGEPNDQMIDAIKSDVDKLNAKRIIAIGGGAILDIAKVLVLDGNATTEDLFTGKAKAAKCRSLVIVPTTCGTGSEVTNLSICEIKSLKTKLGLALPELMPDVAALVPELLASLDYRFFATSSIDALVHAVESYLSPKANTYSKMYSEKAISMILEGYLYVVTTSPNKWKDKAENFLLASNLAGIAFGNAGCAAVHALAYPLGGRYHIPHGQANQLMFMGVLNTYQEKKSDESLLALKDLITRILGAEDAFDALQALLEQILPAEKLRSFGIPREELSEFTEVVLTTQQRLLGNNYVPLSREEILSIYAAAY